MCSMPTSNFTVEVYHKSPEASTIIGQFQIPLQNLEDGVPVTITEALKPGPDRRSVTGSISLRCVPLHRSVAAVAVALALTVTLALACRLRYAYPHDMMPGTCAVRSTLQPKSSNIISVLKPFHPHVFLIGHGDMGSEVARDLIGTKVLHRTTIPNSKP
jgi:hypothetical protein